MNIQISNLSSEPIYLQIKNQLKAAIITGEMKEDEQLPSIRYLAKELRISVITTKRAYDELEAEGFITSVQGKGSFVSRQNEELIREEQLKQIEEALMEAIEKGKLIGLTIEDLQKNLEVLGGHD
ncbi:GntR family transcriptional regulator [Allofustis seminis]|uniref:GntR family transcriptional regulator n=1 Tax=Allofustis seminis TaxID=166939 RepID=UPI0003668F82|nr:GntR family transcriptional regulator [Allofustis seminis]